MESTKFRHSRTVYRKKIALLALAVLLGCNVSYAQSSESRRFYDYARTFHFGFTIGTSLSTFKYKLSSNWYNQNPRDSISKVGIKSYPGITLGAVADLHFGRSYIREHFDLRAIPSLVLTQRRITYTYGNGQGSTFKDVESALVELPVMMKMKSDRFGNMRFYVIGGANYAYDLSSNARASKSGGSPEGDRVAIYPSNFYYEYGVGLDLYFQFFKFSPEVKLSKGVNNLLAPDPSIYSNIFSGFRSNIIYFSLYFEG